MKKIISAMLAAGMIMTGGSVFAQDVSVVFNGSPLQSDVSAFIENDRTLVPMRAIFEAVGASVNWDDDTDTVIAAYKVGGQDKFVILQIGNNAAFVNGTKVDLDVPAKIVSDRTFVPLRFVMESLGYDVTWNPDSYTVDVKTE